MANNISKAVRNRQAPRDEVAFHCYSFGNHLARKGCPDNRSVHALASSWRQGRFFGSDMVNLPPAHVPIRRETTPSRSQSGDSADLNTQVDKNGRNEQYRCLVRPHGFVGEFLGRGDALTL
jgi:hypothetical protein